MKDSEILALVNEVEEFLEVNEFNLDGGGNDPTLIIRRNDIPFETIEIFDDPQVVALSFREKTGKKEKVEHDKKITYEVDEVTPDNIGNQVIDWIEIILSKNSNIE